MEKTYLEAIIESMKFLQSRNHSCFFGLDYLGRASSEPFYKITIYDGVAPVELRYNNIAMIQGFIDNFIEEKGYVRK